MSKQFTNRESQSLDKYLQEIGKIELLAARDEIDLAKRIRNGDQVALEILTKANLRFVVSVAKQYQNRGLALGDLINEGNLGLIKAAKKFDETKGFKFISYAVWWIRQGILQAIGEDSRIVRLPLNRVGTVAKIAKAHKKLEQEYERAPNADELANELQISVNEVAYALEISGRHISMDAPLTQSEETTSLLGLIPDSHPEPDSSLMLQSLKEDIENSISTLTEREAVIIRSYFGLNTGHSLTLEELGEKLNLTRERVRQIKEKALKRLRHSTRSENLMVYLG
ncbi:MAG: RNA polymerase sigma factor RpoD/SigA [Syntrophomonadaceae bacterium]